MRQLLVFARTPRPGTVKTRLTPTLGADGACRLYRAFLVDLAAELRRLSNTIVHWIVDGPAQEITEVIGDDWAFSVQPSGDLGQRLCTAFQQAFGRGSGPVAAVGTDCPLLSASDLEALFAALANPLDAALIPAEDGGYAGLALASRCDAAFHGIPWSTSGVLTATCRTLGTAGRHVRLLPPRRDVDIAEDLGHLTDALAAAPERAPATREVLTELRWAAPSLKDALGRSIPAAVSPRRILSLVPSVTECLFDVGAGARVAGRTDFCISPPAAGVLPSVGGPKTVDLARALALRPDLVLANAEENERGQVEALIGAGLRVHVAFPRTMADAAAFLRDLGHLIGESQTLERLARDLERMEPPPEPRVPVACLIWRAPYMTASGDTLTSALLEAAGAENVFAGRPERYPSVTGEDLAASGARLVLLPSEPYEFTEADVREVERLAPGSTALRIPGEWVTWYGSRMVEAIEGLRRTLGPFR